MSTIYLKDIVSIDDPIFDCFTIERVKFNRSNKTINIFCHGLNIISVSQYHNLVTVLNKLYTPNNVIVSMQYDNDNCNSATFMAYCNYIAYHYSINSLTNCSCTYNQQWILNFLNEHDLQQAQSNLSQITLLLQQFGFKQDNYQLTITNDDFQVETKQVAVPVTNNQSETVVKQTNGGYHRSNKGYSLETLANVDYEKKFVKVECDVFKIDNRQLKKGTTLQTLYLSDDYEAILGKRFEGSNCSIDDINAIKVGMHLMVYGDFENDSYEKEIILKIRKIEILEKETLVDPAVNKRIELHCHSTISEMDGVVEAADIVNFAYDIGHKGVAITDHIAVQEFPKIQRAVAAINKKDPDRNFKAIYGVEANVVKDRFTIVRNLDNDYNLDDLTYCVYDLETTGLSNYFDSIIEFGAVKIKNGKIIATKQTFINPQREIPSYIQQKTNISNEDVADAKTFAQLADELIEFIGDSVLVAHNASFDYPFLNASLKRINKPQLNNLVIDTLDLSKALFPERKTYRLGNIARQYHIEYDEEVAHRADYDAAVLADVFLALLNTAYEKGVTTLKQLNDYNKDLAYLKNRAYHTILLAKNQAGIKAIYKLVSLSETQRLAVFGKNASDGEAAAEPRMYYSDIQQYRNDLYVSSACQNSLLFEIACNREDELLEKEMQFYDLIEIQPLENYRNLLVRKAIPSLEQLKKILMRIINMAIKLNKPLIATGDVHYLLPKDKIIRDIYINTLQIGGARHPLYIYDENLRKTNANPDQHFRLTDEMLDCYQWIDNIELVQQMVIDNPNKIWETIEMCIPVPSGLYPPKIEGSDEKLTQICYDTATKMYGNPLPDIVKARLEKELNSIISNGYSVIYYISHLLVKKSNEDGYLVGSRGSVGSSFVATMSGITEVNPLQPHYVCPKCHWQKWIDDDSVASGFDLPDIKCPNCDNPDVIHGNGHNIPFETFLGFKGDKVPDIDLNFSGEYQPNAHLFTRSFLGIDHVFRAGTIGTVADKTAFGYVQGYCEQNNIMHMKKAYKEYLAAKCAGVKRTTGQHPGGIICIPQDMEAEDFTPVQFPANDPKSAWRTTHFDFHDIHDNVLKFDILGHVDPTAMRLLQNISHIDPKSIPMNDKETLSLFSSANALKADPKYYNEPTGALGLPEFGTQFVRRILEETKPTTFSDLIIISGLSHGTDVWANNAADLIHDKVATLQEVIGCRDDIMTYLIHKELPSKDAFTIMESVRKGKGLKPEWIELMQQHNVPDWYIQSCLKIKYMFPKAHAIAYVIMAIRIAWFKVHHPTYYYISFFSLRCDAYEIETMTSNIDTIMNRLTNIRNRYNNIETKKDVSDKELAIADTLEVTLEMYARGYKIKPIDLYRSQAKEFVVDPQDEKAIIPPFVTIDSLGENVALSIVKAREQQPFISKQDLKARTQLSTSLIDKLAAMHVLDDLQEQNQMSLF